MNYQAKFVKNGNIKLGRSMWTFNKLAGNGTIEGCKGTCGEYCTGCYNKENPRKSSCYVFKSYLIYPSVIQSHKRNTLAMRNDLDQAFQDLTSQLSKSKQKPGAIRIHSSGELESAAELKKWIELSRINPQTTFYLYTKAVGIVDEVLTENSQLPQNFFVNISIWHDQGLDCYNRWKSVPNIRAFVYDDGYDYSNSLKIDKYCPAYQKNKNGKVILKHDITCDVCKLCFKDKNKVVGCLNH